MKAYGCTGCGAMYQDHQQAEACAARHAEASKPLAKARRTTKYDHMDSEKPVWLQRWHVLTSGELCTGICRSDGHGEPYEPAGVVETDGGCYPPALGGEAELIAEAPRMVRVLLMCEWLNLEGLATNACPACDVERPAHENDCPLHLSLIACGFADQNARDVARLAIRSSGIWP